jgi:hypothetical protein
MATWVSTRILNGSCFVPTNGPNLGEASHYASVVVRTLATIGECHTCCVGILNRHLYC